ncbi:hypothetical protein DRH27_01775 [Candidatus Falkowbacteria bacterium]|nr:MAG: hypothetical protein DRH27_01775 [Candidatus Falkowbacteria bacterium]
MEVFNRFGKILRNDFLFVFLTKLIAVVLLSLFICKDFNLFYYERLLFFVAGLLVLFLANGR